MAKNLWSKTVSKENAYLVTTDGNGWTYYVLKAYKARKSEKADPYARWLCLVVTPYTGSSGDMGDTYVSDVPLNAADMAVLNEREAAELAADAAAKGGK